MNPLQDVFISYGRADSYYFAKTLNERLVAENLDVWFDFDDIPLGVDYQKQIDDGLDKADNFLFIISPHAINSDERIKARQRENPIIKNASLQLWPEFSNEISCNLDTLPNMQGKAGIILDGNSYFFQVSELKDEINLDWCMVTLIAEEEVMSEIQKSYLLTVTILVSSLVMAGMLAIYVYRTIRLSADLES